MRWRTRQRLIVAVLMLAVFSALATLATYSGGPHNDQRAIQLARQAASSFLRRYVAANGRVVRHDQGGDTVSEGQAYAMLLAVALDHPHQFARAWSWDRQHMQRPDGLFAWHWADGAIVDQNPATDADLDTAWALLLAARRFHHPTYRWQAFHVGAGILANETTTVGTGLAQAAAPWAPDPAKLMLVAGPWARTSRAAADPSYDAPQALAALAAATADPRWAQIKATSASLLQLLELGRPAKLPPNWVILDTGGTVHPAATPTRPGQPAYGLDAQRILIWQAASCSTADKDLAATAWPVLRHTPGNGGAIAYTPAGRRLARAASPLGLVAAAAAADAAGARHAATHLLNQATARTASTPTYYGSAWTALGRVLLDTNWLSPCPPRPTSGQLQHSGRAR